MFTFANDSQILSPFVILIAVKIGQFSSTNLLETTKPAHQLLSQ